MFYRTLTIMLLLAAALIACGGESTPQATVPTPTAPATAAATVEAAVVATPTSEPTAGAPDDAAQTGSSELVPFEEPDGLFALSAPAGYEAHRGGAMVGDYTHLFVSPTGSGAIVVSLGVGSDTDDEAPWRALVRDRGLVKVFTTQISLPFMREVSRQGSPDGEHELLVHMASEDAAETPMKGIIWIGESEGTLAALIWALPAAEWDEQSRLLQPLLDSFSWSPTVARELLGAAEE